MTYTELVTAVSAYCETVFNTDSMNTLIAQAEKRIYVAAQFPALRKTSTGALTASNKFLNCPTDFLSTYSLAIIDATGAYSFALNKDVSFIREAYPTPTSTGFPKYYALFGPRSDTEKELTFIVGPTPDAAYAVEISYFYYPESIVTAGSTWLSENFDPVLLYATLVEAYTFMKGEADMMELYEKKFKEALVLAKQLGEGLEQTDAYRAGQIRQAVK